MDETQIKQFRIDRLKELSNQFGGNTALGKKLGYSSGAHIGNLISGFRPITEKFIVKTEQSLRLNGWFSPSVEVDQIHIADTYESDGVQIPMLTTKASMGMGEEVLERDFLAGAISVSPQWIKENLTPVTASSNLRFIHAYGDSMEPTFKSGDVLLVDSGVNSADIDGIYVLEAQQRLFVKRVTQDVFGKHTVSSDNPNVKTVSVLNGGNEVSILGRVLWAWNGKRL